MLTAIDFLISNVDLGPVINDVEADITPEGVNLLRVTDTYHRVVGYLAECKVAQIRMLGTSDAFGNIEKSQNTMYDPLDLGPEDIEILAQLVRNHEASERAKAAA